MGRREGHEMNTIKAAEASEFATSADRTEIRLQDLIPIVMVVVGGCENCAEKMVMRALAEGSSWQDIDRTLRIVSGMQKLDCFAKAVGPEVLARMEKPLTAGRRTLDSAIVRATAGCGCKS
jgi:hypothetical protein